MSTQDKIISPIAIDLGAKNTGAYFAHYKAGSSIEDIDKAGKVYLLEKDKYTLLMADRTATRHQRRGYDRRQMVKRLFKLIWEKHFKLPWDEDIQQTISFLFNRRGFTFLTEQYDPEILSRFPEEAYKKLPQKLKDLPVENETGEYDFYTALIELANKEKKDIEDIYKAINKKPDDIKTKIDEINKVKFKLELMDCTQSSNEYCNKLLTNNLSEDNSKSVLKVNKEILDNWNENKVSNLPKISGKNKTVDMINHLNGLSQEKISDLQQRLPNFSEEEREGLKEEKAKLEKEKNSIEDIDLWDFSKNFKKEEAKFGDLDGPNIKTHLQHLHFAIEKTNHEITSGGRHRSRYFEEVKNVLEENKHSHNYLKEFCRRLKKEEFNELNSDNLSNLICHLSNFELKPLRKYFNDSKHKKGDYWRGEKELTDIFGHWIMKQWRVGEKDKDKVAGKQGDYAVLKGKWDEYKQPNKIIDFWLETCPFFTIPPYQNNNNRRPPRCQSLVLNPIYLDNEYPRWREWLHALKDLDSTKEYLGAYKKELKDDLKSSSGKPYFSDDESKKSDSKNKKLRDQRFPDDLRVRLFQFILDRTKDTDPLKLNEIYSYAKKYRQTQSSDKEKQEAKGKLEKTIVESALPDELKTPRNYENCSIFLKKTFLHLVYCYYKQRQRAREGRLYIHPKYHFIKGRGYERTRHYYDKKCLLRYCNHKPRQKQYQMFYDIAALLQISTEDLKKFIDSKEETLDEQLIKNKQEKINKKLFNWLKSIRSMESTCKKAAQEQKKHRGYLKSYVRNIYALINREKQDSNPSDKEIKEILERATRENKKDEEILERATRENKKDEEILEQVEVYGICKAAIDLLGKANSKNLTEGEKDFKSGESETLWKDQQKEQTIDDLKKNPDKAIHLLAQIYNIVFKERSGNAKTCAVCSADNAQRMQTIMASNDSHAKASRLPAISTRVIDGAVMRMARIVGDAIAEDKWQQIEKELKQGNKIRIPIITESNQFEFEPNLDALKKSKKKSKTSKKKKIADGVSNDITEQEKRIKDAGYRTCPYSGQCISVGGEIDHIIPRRSVWGTLNDEANFIWASHIGNQHKTNQPVTIDGLSRKYKDKQFPGKSDEDIKQWIHEMIDGENDNFKFGTYRNFINIQDDNHQTAFRHALFLEEGDPLRKKVINAISNRNRAFVNGTQRYFAEMLANSLYKKYIKLIYPGNKKNLLSFDYFGTNATEISNLRKHFQNKKKIESEDLAHPEIKENEKSNKPQTEYSHLIDAQLAFLVTASNHCKEGSLDIEQHITSYEFFDQNGEVKDPYEIIKIDINKFYNNREENILPLERHPIEPTATTKFSHRTLFNDESLAWHFLSLIQIKSNDKQYYLKGFLDLSTLKLCLKEDDFKDAIEKKYGYHYGPEDNKEYYPYGELLEDKEANNLIKLYELGQGKYQFGYQGEQRSKSNKGNWPKIVMDKQKLGQNYFTVHIYNLDKTKIAKFLLDNFNTASDPNNWNSEVCKILDCLSNLLYFTKYQKISKKDDIEDYKLKDFKFKSFLNPSLLRAWTDLRTEWEKLSDEDKENIKSFCGKFFRKNSGNNTKSLPHQKARKDFSLPNNKVNHQKFLVCRRNKIFSSSQREFIYQCLSGYSKSKGRLSRFVKTESTKEVLVSQYRKPNIFIFPSSDASKAGKASAELKKRLSPLENLRNRDQWHKVKLDILYRKNEERIVAERQIIKLEEKLETNTKCPWYRLTFKEKPKLDGDFIMLTKFIRKPNSISAKYFNDFIEQVKKKDEQQLKQWYKELDERIDKLKSKQTDKEEIKKEIDELEKQKRVYNIFSENHNKIYGNKLELQKG